MFLAHHATAVASGARLPARLRLRLRAPRPRCAHAVLQLPDDRPITLRGVVRATGGVSGGTLASLLNAFSRIGPMRAAARERRAADPIADGRRSTGVTGRPAATPTWASGCCRCPAIDQDVVARSGAALAAYGPDFRYSHYAGLGNPLVLGGALAGVTVGLAGRPGRAAAPLRLEPAAAGHRAVRRGAAAASFTVDFVGAPAPRRCTPG